ncbi:MAG TPA: 50S ribosomal protein L25/general stress protein Ctc [Pseudomonadales bacterium]|nr:50S ribosomal protein L25/general stress protein Ctc [Pseudomonadales bacterium]
MADKMVLSAEPRSDVGKGASRRLRRLALRVPGIVYGGGVDPQMISVLANDLVKAQKFESFYSQILELSVEGTTQQVIVRDLQRNPARNDIVHIDFQRVRADQEMHVNLQIHVLGEDVCKGVRLSKGQIMHQMVEVAVACLPAALPEYLTVDVTDLDIGDSIHLSSIVLPEGVRIPELELGEDHDQPVVSVIESRVQEEPEEEEGEEAKDEDDEKKKESDED